jgi:hypothetical protein
MISPEWTIIRTFVAQVAEGHAAAPADNLFVLPAEPHERDLLVSFEGVAFTGTPNSGTFWLWSLHTDQTTSVKEKLAEIIVAGTESPWMMPVTIRSGPARLYITIDAYNGGVGGPSSVDGTIKCRRVSL